SDLIVRREEFHVETGAEAVERRCRIGTVAREHIAQIGEERRSADSYREVARLRQNGSALPVGKNRFFFDHNKRLGRCRSRYTHNGCKRDKKFFHNSDNLNWSNETKWFPFDRSFCKY